MEMFGGNGEGDPMERKRIAALLQGSARCSRTQSLCLKRATEVRKWSSAVVSCGGGLGLGTTAGGGL